METSWSIALWRQFGAALDMLDNALVACPAALWTERLWPGTPSPQFPPQFSEFWYISFHTLVWLDLYLSGVPEEAFAPPLPSPEGRLIPSRRCPTAPIRRKKCAPISCPCAGRATARWSR